MFCSKCGNQLANGSAFCPVCGTSQVNPAQPPVNTQQPVMMQPSVPTPTSVGFTTDAISTAPMGTVPNYQPVNQPMQAAPDATPVNPVPQQPMEPANQPVMEPIFAAPTEPVNQFAEGSFNPAGQPVQGTQFNATAAVAPAKKSKAPLFIGLGIGALIIAIVVIVLILVLGGDDEDSDKKTNSTGNTTVAGEDETTGSGSSSDFDLNDAEEVVSDFLDAMEWYEYDDASELFIPGYEDFMEDSGYTIEETCDIFIYEFCDPDFFFLDYSIEDVYEDDSDYFYDNDYDDLLSSFDSYIEPEAFAAADIEFTYEDQSSSIVIYLAYVDGSFYVYDYDSSDFYIDFEEEDPTPSGDTETVADMLENNYIDLYDTSVTGTTYTGDGYTFTAPDGWTDYSDTYSLPFFESPDSETAFIITSDAFFQSLGAEAYFEELKADYESDGYYNFEVGTLYTPAYTGYACTYTYIDDDGYEVYGWQYFFLGDTTTYIFTSETYDTYGETAITADKVVATFTMQ